MLGCRASLTCVVSSIVSSNFSCQKMLKQRNNAMHYTRQACLRVGVHCLVWCAYPIIQVRRDAQAGLRPRRCRVGRERTVREARARLATHHVGVTAAQVAQQAVLSYGASPRAECVACWAWRSIGFMSWRRAYHSGGIPHRGSYRVHRAYQIKV